MSRRSNAAWADKMGYGRKGGTSATAGRKAGTYRVRFPDGTSAEKRSFQAIQPEAIAYVYQHEGRWYCAGIHDEDAAHMKHYQTVTAERVR